MTSNESSKITQIEDIIKLNERKNKEFDKINKNHSYLEVNETCLLNPKFLIIGKNNSLKKKNLRKKKMT